LLALNPRLGLLGGIRKREMRDRIQMFAEMRIVQGLRHAREVGLRDVPNPVVLHK
jgi:hypothetical protein